MCWLLSLSLFPVWGFEENSLPSKKTKQFSERPSWLEHRCNYLRIENAEGNVLIAVYLFIYLYPCYSQNSKSIEPNRMKFGGMIGYYPGTI